MHKLLLNVNLIKKQSVRIGQKEFIAEYESKLKEIKNKFRAYKCLEKDSLTESSNKFLLNMDYENKKSKYMQAIEELQRFVQDYFDYFDLTKVSSMFGFPSRELEPEERVFHRLWVGGNIPEDTKESIRQWGEACIFVQKESSVTYKSYLWVWDKAQIINDPAFELAENNEDYTIGYYHITNAKQIVKSIRVMSEKNSAFIDLEMMKELVYKRFYNYLSDYYRDVFLYLFGGIYMDIDTIPHRYASVFLTKPEVPDYYDYTVPLTTGEERKNQISWLNIWQFEGGVQIAKKGNSAIKAIVEEMNRRLKTITRPLSAVSHSTDKDMKLSLQLYEATYVVWASDLRITFMPLDELTITHSVLLSRKTERVLLGLSGFRLDFDPTTNSSMPFSNEEKWHHDNTIEKLNQLDWYLDNPLELADCARIMYVEECPRFGYNLQVRSENSKYNYYAFATNDSNLHRVNDLFGRFILYANRARMTKPNFWLETKGKKLAETAVYLCPGSSLNDNQKNRLAFLLLETSYLEYCSVGNKLQLQKIPLQRVQNIDQNIDFCQAILNHNQQLIGFFIAGMVGEMKKVKFTSYYRDEVKPLDEAYDAFVVKSVRDEDYFLSSLAIEPKFRGQGYFKFMFEQVLLQAKKAGSNRIVLTVWEESEAVEIYLKMGFEFVDTFDYPFSLFFEKLYLMEYHIR